MPTDKEFKNIITALDQQKGELLYLHALFNSLMRSMPPEVQSDVIGHFDEAVEPVRRALLFSQASDDVTASFEHYVGTLQNRKLQAP
jgi:hypothetical protein